MSDDPTTRILAAIAKVSGEVTELRADMTELRADMTELRGDMIQLRVDMMGRMDRLQNAFSSMQQDITVNFAASDRADRMARNATDETRALADQVSAMVRQIRVLTVRVDEIDRRGNGHAKQG